MWRFISIIFIFIILRAFAYPDPVGDEINKEMFERRLSFKQQEFMSLNSECISKKWYCQRECRFQFFENSRTCRIPSPDEQCFGMPIRYNYTWNKAIQHFPRELELLKRFPKCWSFLGPLICSSIYRPCSKNQYIEAAMKEPGFIEMWEVFPAQMCQKAMNECSFVIENGLWPDFLKCNNFVELTDDEYPVAHTPEQQQRLFTDQANCTATNIDTQVTFPSEQCLWPLVKGAPDLVNTKSALPLMDSCYLPCETPIAGFDWMLEGFRRRNSIIACITGIVFLVITIYLMGFSKIYQTSLCVFCLAQSFLCITFYLTLWFISGSKSIRSAVFCVDGGRIRRHSSLATLDPCALEAILSTFTLLAANFWLCTLLLLRIFRPKIRNDNYFIYNSRGNEMSARTALSVLAYLGLPIGLFIAAIVLWHDLPVDPISGICHVGVGSLRHSLILHGTLGFFSFIIVASSIYVAIQKRLQERELERSLSCDVEKNQSALLDSEEKQQQQSNVKKRSSTKTNSHADNDDEERDSYTLEHGLGDALFSDYWLGIIALAFIATSVISTFIQYTIITDMGQKAEEDKILFSIQCSLNSIKNGQEIYQWWNRTLNFDHQTIHADPYLRKAVLFNSATAPNCEMPVITEGQVFGIFMIAIILPSLPLWISAVCFFSGFCDHGLKSVRKVRTHLNPFIRESHLQREHRHQNGTELDTFLERGNERRQQTIISTTKEEDVERHSEITETQSGMSAPARLETTPAYNADGSAVVAGTTTTSSQQHAISKRNGVPPNAPGSVHSEPLPSVSREPRKLDLNQKRLQHKRERIQFLEHQKSQTKKLFAIPQPSQQPLQQPLQQQPRPYQQQQQQPIQQPLHQPIQQPLQQQQQQQMIPSIEALNQLFGYPSYENLGSQSSFNMTSVSQQLPYYPPPVNMELIAKVQELTAQNNQLMGNNFKALDTITQLVESFNLMAYSIKFWSGNIAQQVPSPELPNSDATMYQKEPPIAKIPVKIPSNGSSAVSNGTINGMAKKPAINQQKQQQQLQNQNHREQKKINNSSKIPKIKIENVSLSGKAVPPTAMINGTKKPEIVAPNFDDTSGEDDDGGGGDENWFLPNPPAEIYQQWNALRQQYNAANNDQDPFQMSDEEIEENLLFRIVSHCGSFLPPWIFRNFRDSVTELFDEFYTEDEHRSETLNSLKLYPDTEPMEAAVEKKLHAYIWPLICKAIQKTAVEMHLNYDIFGTDKSDWITSETELEYFRSLMDDDLSSASSDDDDDSMNEFLLQQSAAATPNYQQPPQQQRQRQQQQQQRQPPDLEALAQERIDEVSEEEY